MNKGFKILLPSLAVIAALFAVIWLVGTDPTSDFVAGVPGEDRDADSESMVQRQVVKIGEFFESFTNRKNATTTENWPWFRGENHDNISVSKTPLIDNFSADGAPVLWQYKLGEGHAGAAIYNGLVYLLDYNEDERADMLHCYDLKTGEELWRRWYSVNIKRNHGMSRTIPAVTEDYILTIGPRCHVMCVERESGDFLWGLDVEAEYESEVPLWYTGQCPLIDEGEAIIAPGGTALMIGVDCKTGKINWSVPNPEGWKMSHASVLPYTFQGKRMFLYSAVGAVYAVSAEKEDRGTLLWAEKAWNHSVVAPSALGMPDGKIFLTAGYGAGSMMIQLEENNGKYSTTVLDEYKPRDGLACEQQTPLFFDNHLIGIAPKDAGNYRNQLLCVHPSDPKNIIWASGKETRFGLGPYMIADGKIFLLNDDGTLVIIEATTKEYRELSRYKFIEGHDAWAPLAIANGFMVLRDAETLMCIDLNKR